MYQHYVIFTCVMGRWAFLINCTGIHVSLIWRILICRRIRGSSQPGWWVQPLTSYQDTYSLHTCSFSGINPCNWYFQWPSYVRIKGLQNLSWSSFENSTFILFFSSSLCFFPNPLDPWLHSLFFTLFPTLFVLVVFISHHWLGDAYFYND